MCDNCLVDVPVDVYDLSCPECGYCEDCGGVDDLHYEECEVGW
jgi:hypothetical protein